jgi:hypothetical protein
VSPAGAELSDELAVSELLLDSAGAELDDDDDDVSELVLEFAVPPLLPQAAVTMATDAAIAATAIHLPLRIRAPI